MYAAEESCRTIYGTVYSAATPRTSFSFAYPYHGKFRALFNVAFFVQLTAEQLLLLSSTFSNHDLPKENKYRAELHRSVMNC